MGLADTCLSMSPLHNAIMCTCTRVLHSSKDVHCDFELPKATRGYEASMGYEEALVRDVLSYVGKSISEGGQ